MSGLAPPPPEGRSFLPFTGKSVSSVSIDLTSKAAGRSTEITSPGDVPGCKLQRLTNPRLPNLNDFNFEIKSVFNFVAFQFQGKSEE